MIEFVLLFALGFLAAALVALIVAPIIQRRIVTLTERRIRASVPLSATEIRAEKDMARAAYAADNARLSVDLKKNRDDLAQATARATVLSNDLVALRAEKLAADQTIEERDASIRELSAQVHRRDEEVTVLTSNLSAAIRLSESRKRDIAEREDKINRLGAEIEEMRIDIATLSTETENFKAQIRELRDERRALRETLKEAEAEKQDIAFRLKREEDRLAEAEQKLAKSVSTLTDRENALERRVAEVERFKQKNASLANDLKAARRDLTTALREAQRGANGTAASRKRNNARPKAQPALKAVETEPVRPAGQDNPSSPPQDLSTTAVAASAIEDEPINGDLSESEKIDRLRARQAALNERLLKADSNGNDAALRREIATVAAMMVELTASRDRDDSPIRKILQGSEERNRPASADPSLAARARDMIAAGN